MSDTQAFLACDKCPRLFKSQEYRELHKKVHEMKNPRICHICKAVFGATKGLEEHLSSHKPKSNIANPDVVRVLASHQITLPPSTELVIKMVDTKSKSLNGSSVKGRQISRKKSRSFFSMRSFSIGEQLPHKVAKSMNGQSLIDNGTYTVSKDEGHSIGTKDSHSVSRTMSLKSENEKSHTMKCLKKFSQVIFYTFESVFLPSNFNVWFLTGL